MKWVWAALVLLLTAVAFDLGLLVYAIYALVVIFGVANYVTSRWSNNIEQHRLVSRSVADIGDTVDIQLSVTNLDQWPITWMVVEDLLARTSLGVKPALEVEGQRLAVLKFAGREQHQLNYRFLCRRRGYFQIGPALIETGDWFGFNRRFRAIGEPQFLMVYPQIIPLFRYEITSRRPIGEIVMTNRLFEDPSRIAGVRDYQPGDALNRVHWKKSASLGKLQSKTFEPSCLAGATIVIDFHIDSFDPKHEPVRSELAITTAASMAAALVEMGQQVGLVSNARHAMDRIREHGWSGDQRTRDQLRQRAGARETSDRMQPVIVPTRKGTDQAIQIFRALACLELTDGMRLPNLLIEASSQLPRDATVIAIVCQMNMETAIALGSLRQQGYSVVAVVNTFSEDRFEQTTAPLVAHGIGAMHLKDETSIPTICERQALMI